MTWYSIQELLWDVDPAQLDAGVYASYVVERLMEFGDLPAVRWMLAKL